MLLATGALLPCSKVALAWKRFETRELYRWGQGPLLELVYGDWSQAGQRGGLCTAIRRFSDAKARARMAIHIQHVADDWKARELANFKWLEAQSSYECVSTIDLRPPCMRPWINVGTEPVRAHAWLGANSSWVGRTILFFSSVL